MNQTNVNDISMIIAYLGQLYLEYSIQIGRFEIPSAPRPLPNHKKEKVRLFEVLLGVL